MGHKKKKYKIIYPEYKECNGGMDIRIRPLKLYDENGFAPQYRLNEGKYSWDEIQKCLGRLESDIMIMRAEFKEKAKEFSRENRRKEREEKVTILKERKPSRIRRTETRQKERLLVNNNKLTSEV
ncbi:hypothetical protein ES703_78895 [subsurface metagenome]